MATNKKQRWILGNNMWALAQLQGVCAAPGQGQGKANSHKALESGKVIWSYSWRSLSNEMAKLKKNLWRTVRKSNQFLASPWGIFLPGEVMAFIARAEGSVSRNMAASWLVSCGFLANESAMETSFIPNKWDLVQLLKSSFLVLCGKGDVGY